MNKEEIALKLTEIYINNYAKANKYVLARNVIGEIYNEYLDNLKAEFVEYNDETVKPVETRYFNNKSKKKENKYEV